LDVPVLVGTSRKSFIKNTLQDGTDGMQPDVIETGTQASIAASVMNGAHIVRVHDVASTVATVKIIDAVKNA